MQVVGMRSGNLGYKYNGAFDALRVIVRTEGIVGLYRGLWPNLREHLYNVVFFSHGNADPPLTVKVAPSIATSFFTYELVKDFLAP